ncbi:MAG TPA: hypothetical protein VJL32_00550 [Candidatus Paceibacterota bacterium]
MAKHTIITTDNQKLETDCIACSIARQEISFPGGIIEETKFFQVANDFEIPIPSFLIINSKRHFGSLADFTEEEAADFIDFLVRVRSALRKVSGAERITIVQEEKTTDSHFHVWLFPWYPWMKEIGSGLAAIQPIMEFARTHHKTEIVLKQIVEGSEKLRIFLNQQLKT